MDPNTRISISLSIAAAVALLIAPFPLPYSYYVVLRWLVTVSALYAIWHALKVGDSRSKANLVLLAPCALIFNPLAPFYMAKESWVVVDIFSSGIFLAHVMFMYEIDEDFPFLKALSIPFGVIAGIMLMMISLSAWFGELVLWFPDDYLGNMVPLMFGSLAVSLVLMALSWLNDRLKNEKRSEH